MRNKIYLLTILIFWGTLAACIWPAIGVAEVIFSDDFSDWDSNYLLTKDDFNPPGGWSYANGGESATFDGVTHYAGEVTTPGRLGDSDRSLKVWRYGAFLYTYDGLLSYRKTDLHATRELYTRWYMKIPSDFTLAEGPCNMNYWKLWRYNYSVNPDEAISGKEIYLNFIGSSFSNAMLAVYAVGDTWRDLVPVSEIRDGKWHCHELRIKLNDEGKDNGVIQYWLDGIERVKIINVNIGAADNEFFSRTDLGVGNTGARLCEPTGEFQRVWRAIEFDDYVLSTTYVGPATANPSPDNEPPSTPTGLKTINISSTQVDLSWDASNDNIGVTTYNIYRNGNKIGTSSSLTYADNSVLPNTYYVYSVSAVDAASNESNHSKTVQLTTPELTYNLILFETWEENNINNWDDDLIVGDTHITTDPVYAGNYAIKMESTNPGNYVHFFGDHPGVDEKMVTDVTLEEYYYLSPGFQFPDGLKLWIMNCFESWNAGYNTAEGQDKPHTWAPYYMTTWVNNKGELAGQLVRADGLGGTGALWENYYQNVGTPVALSVGAWNKIKIRLKLNTIGATDGLYQVWLNDKLIIDYSNINYRGTYSKYGWNHLMMSMHAYPSSPQTQWICRDNIRIYSGLPSPPNAFQKLN